MLNAHMLPTYLQTWFGYANASIEDPNYQVSCCCLRAFWAGWEAAGQQRTAGRWLHPQRDPTCP